MRHVTRLWGGGGGRSSTVLLKRVLLSLLVVGLLGTVTAKRVYAVFVTESVNSRDVAAAGTFTINVAIGTQTACRSQDGAFVPGPPTTISNQNSCTGASGTLFASTPRYPGDANTVRVTVTNSGSIDSQDLKVTIPTCTSIIPSGQNDACSTNSPPAGGLRFEIQETSSSWVDKTNGCLYPDANIDPPGVGTQYASCDGTNWEADSFANFPRTTACWDLGRIPANTSRYFVVGLEFPSDSANTWQGTGAQFALTFHPDSVDGAVSTANCVND